MIFSVWILITATGFHRTACRVRLMVVRILSASRLWELKDTQIVKIPFIILMELLNGSISIPKTGMANQRKLLRFLLTFRSIFIWLLQFAPTSLMLKLSEQPFQP